MNLRVRSFLIELARHPRKNYIHYQELCRECGLGLDMSKPEDRKEIGHILGVISTFEFKKSRPLLSALVVSTNFEEGDGFFKLCVELGMGGSWKKLKDDPAFVSLRINECVEFWKDETHYLAFRDDVNL